MALDTLDVLIVDDNVHMRALIRSVLRALGVTKVREADDGGEALVSLQARPADVILLDYAMPEMDGFEFLRRLRLERSSPAPQARVIIVTGYGDLKRVAEARDLGADEFLIKPLTAKSLLDRLEAVISRPRPFVETGDFLGPDRRRRDAELPTGEDRRIAQQGELVQL